MSKITLADIADITQSTSAQTTINNNSSIIETAFDNTLSRDGTSPNQMGAGLDMNSNRIINLPAPVNSQEPVRLQDLATFAGGGTINTVPAGGSTGDSLVKTSSADYAMGWNHQSQNVLAGSNITATGTSPVTVALSNSPVLVTPNIGVATATSVNGLTVTPTTGTLTVASPKTVTHNAQTTFGGIDSKTLNINNSLTLAGTDSTTITFQGTDTYVGRATTDTFTNKTYDTAGTGNSFKVNGSSISAVTGTGSTVMLNTAPSFTGVITATGTAPGQPGFTLSSYGAAANSYPQINLQSARGTVGTPTASQSNDFLFVLSGLGYNSGFKQTASIFCQATEVYSAGHQGSTWTFFTTPTASATITQALQIQASGGLSVGTSTDPGTGSILANADLYSTNANFLIRTKATLANGAAASTGTLTNAPAAGNPTKWISIDDNGTTRKIPAW